MPNDLTTTFTANDLEAVTPYSFGDVDFDTMQTVIALMTDVNTINSDQTSLTVSGSSRARWDIFNRINEFLNATNNPGAQRNRGISVIREFITTNIRQGMSKEEVASALQPLGRAFIGHVQKRASSETGFQPLGGPKRSFS